MPTLTPDDIARFETDGAVMLRAAFPREAVAAMEELIWRRFATAGIGMSNPDSLRFATSRPLKCVRDHGTFAGIRSARLQGAIVDLAGAGRWSFPAHWGPIRVTAPTPGPPWEPTPNGWHADSYPFDDQRNGLFVLIHLGETVPGGGGTLLLAGSHRRLQRLAAGMPPGRRSRRRLKAAFCDGSPWMRQLLGAEPCPTPRASFCTAPSPPDEDGVRLRVIECTGQAGDVWLCHPCTYHAASDNRAVLPRIMRIATLSLDPGHGRDDPGVDTPLMRSVRAPTRAPQAPAAAALTA